MNDNFFKIREFCIEPGPIPIDIAQKIVDYHIKPMNFVRYELGRPIIVSDRSGFRPKLYEVNKGRSGRSQHCFEGNGAADYTCSGDINELLELIMKETQYTRVCYYKEENFIHCDYGIIDGDRRQLFIDHNGWEFVKFF